MIFKFRNPHPSLPLQARRGLFNTLGRREFLRLGAAAGGVALFSGCGRLIDRSPLRSRSEHASLPSGLIDPVCRLVNRVSFGPTPGELKRVTSMGAEAYVEEQLKAQQDDPLSLKLKLSRLDVLRMDSMEMMDIPEEEVIRQLQQQALLRAVYGANQLHERMVDFWSNHFNIYARKGLAAFRKGADELKVVRKHALGKFPDMLKASAKSPAMLAYLDNQLNRAGVANENYARELMELHTLGVHGGYTQKDVQELARCLTGWGLERRFLRHKGSFRFDPERHDSGEKYVLGHRIPAGGGVEDGEKVLDILAMHPSTAKFISGKLCRFFLGDWGEKWTERTAQIYLKTGGDIASMLKPILLHCELLEAPPILKRPFDFVVSAMRALEADTDASKPLQRHLDRMGQPLYQWPMPDGYPDKTSSWTGSLLARWNFGVELTHSLLHDSQVDLEALVTKTGLPSREEALLALILPQLASEPPAQLRKELKERRHRLEEAAALCLASPDFQWR